MENEFLNELNQIEEKVNAEADKNLGEDSSVSQLEISVNALNELTAQLHDLFRREKRSYSFEDNGKIRRNDEIEYDVKAGREFADRWDDLTDRIYDLTTKYDSTRRTKTERIATLTRDLERIDSMIEELNHDIRLLETRLKLDERNKHIKLSDVERASIQRRLDFMKSEVAQLEEEKKKINEELEAPVRKVMEELNKDEENKLDNPIGVPSLEPEAVPESKSEAEPATEEPTPEVEPEKEEPKPETTPEPSAEEDEKKIGVPPMPPSLEEMDKAMEEGNEEPKPDEDKKDEDKEKDDKKDKSKSVPVGLKEVVKVEPPKKPLWKALAAITAAVVAFLAGIGVGKWADRAAEKSKKLEPTPTPDDKDKTADVDVDTNTVTPEQNSETTPVPGTDSNPEPAPAPVPEPSPAPAPEPSPAPDTKDEKIVLPPGWTSTDTKTNPDGSSVTVEHNAQGQSVTTQTDAKGNTSAPVIGNVESTKFSFNGQEMIETKVPDASQTQFNREEGVPFNEFNGTQAERDNAYAALFGDQSLQEGASKVLTP